MCQIHSSYSVADVKMDGGFVEPYGSGIKESFSDDSFIAKNVEFNTLNETDILKVINETPEDSPSPYTEILSISQRLNINELYEEILQEILHDVGRDKVCFEQKNIIAFAQEAFNIDQETHNMIHQIVKKKEASKIMLNIEIIEGTNLEPKDPNGSRNPFCTLFLSSKPQHKYVTSIKRQTLQPIWKEHFSLSIENPATDILHVEVWDFTPEETDKEKGAKTGEIKGLKGLRKLMKEISTFSKQDKDMVGNTLIPLKKIPSRGQKDWYNLEGKGKRHGSLLVKMAFGKEKNKHVSTQEYRQLLDVLLNHQINLQKIEMHSWMGDFLPESILLIQQHVRQSNISSVEEFLSQWIEFINVHIQRPVINAKVFSDLLDNLVKPIKTGELSSDELKMFWQSAKNILPLYYNFIKTIRNIPLGDQQLLSQIDLILNIFQQLHSLDIPNDVNLFTSHIYDCMSPSKHPRDIRSTLQDAIIQGAVDCHAHTVEINEPQHYTEEKEEEEIKVQLKVINVLKIDLQKALEFHDSLFIKKMQLPYASILFSVYDRKISEMCEPLIDQVCAKMKPINIDENGQFEIDNDPLAIGTSLLELYTEIQNFSRLVNNNSDVDFETIRTTKYHTWFQQSVAGWLDIAACKVMQCTERAVELDNLVKVHSSLDYSSSAVDTLTIFYQIKAFWQQLAWPDVEGSYSFMAKIIDDICKYSLYYSDEMSNKVSRTVDENQIFEVTKEWCLAVNNIDYIKRSIHPFVNGLGLTELMEKLAHCKSDIEVNQCKKTLELVIDNAIDIVNNRINKLLQMVVDKMAPDITKFLIEGGDVLQINNRHLENLIQYLDDSLCTLNNELNKENFQHILEILIEQIFGITFSIIDKYLEKKKPPPYFRNLRNIFQKLFGFLTNGYETEYSREMIRRLESTLHLHALDTDDLIYEYYSERIEAQKEIKEANEGVLTIKLLFINDTLKINILNAHCLRSMDSNGFSDPFVKIRLVPQNKFQTVIKLKTTVQKKTLSPLFDEIFEIPLAPEQRAEKNAIVMFIIKDQDFMGLRNEFISEAFVHFKDIPSAQVEDQLTSLPQIKLNMTVPKSLDSKILEVLDSRTNDKIAKDFIKLVKGKIAVSNPIPKKY